MTECKDAAEDEMCTMVCSSVQEPQSVLKVCRLQCNNTVKVLLEATRNSPDLVPKQIIDYLILRTTDVRHQMPWCTTNEMANWMAAQLRERFCTGQLWTMRKVHLLLHQLLWRGSLDVATQMWSVDDELIDAGQMIERVLRTRQEHASSVRIVAAMERACALHTPPHPCQQADKGGSSSSSSSSSKDDDYAVAYGASMLAHMRNHIGYLAALYKYRVAYSDMIDLPEMRIIHYKPKRPLSFCDVSHVLHDTLDLLKRTAADDVRAGSYCAFGLAIVHGRVDVDARALYSIAVDLLTKLLVQLYEKARLICLKHRMQLADKKTAALSTPSVTAAAAAATGDGYDGQRGDTSDKSSSSSSSSHNDDKNSSNGHGNASGDGVSVQVLRRELYVLLCKWRDIVGHFNDTIGALARFCADVQRHCGSVLALSSSLRTLSTAVLHDLHTSVRSLQLTLEQGSDAGDSPDVHAVVSDAAGGDGDGGGSGGGSSSSNSNNKHHGSNSNEPFSESYDVVDDGDARVAVATCSTVTATAATMALLYRVVRAQVAALLLLQPSVDSRLLLAALREVLDEDDVDAHTRRQLSGHVNGGGSSSLCTATSTDHDVTGLSSCTSDTLHTIIIDSLPAGPLTPSVHQRPTAAMPPLPLHDTALSSSPASSSPQLQPRERQLLPHDGISDAVASDTAATVAAVHASHAASNGNMLTKRIDDTTAVAQAAMQQQQQQHEQRAQRASAYKNNNDSDDAMHSNDSTNTLNVQHSCSDSNRNEKEKQPCSSPSSHHTLPRSLSEQQQQQQPVSLLRDGSTSTLATSRNDVNAREPRSGAYILRRSVMASLAASRARAPTATTAAVDAAKSGAAGEDAVPGAHDSIDDTTLSQQDTEVIDVTGELDRKCASTLQSLLQSDDVIVVCNETCSCNAMKLADRFQILRDTQLGTGSFGTVYRAWDELKGSYLAAKEIAIDTRKDRGAAVREVLKEYTILTELSHPNIVRVVAFMVVNNIGRIFMEWMPSGSLQDVLRRSMRGALREAVVSRYVHDVLSGLTYLHSRGILHRDVKPANMLLTVDGNVKLTDFGSSFVFGDNRRTLESVSIMGTAPYMAPEAVQGIYSPATDVWALGCSVVELVTGMTPWSDLMTGARMDTIPLIYKIGSLNDTTELDRPHTRLITVKRDGDDGGSNELGNNDAITATTTAAVAVTTVTVMATAQAQTHATTLTTYAATTTTTHNKDDDGADIDGTNALDGVGASVGNTGRQPYYEEGSHVTSRGMSSTDAAMRVDRSALVHVSTELYDFLQHIFVVDRKQRATAEELLSHTFVRKYNKM